jgi:hypothetical protein
MRECGDYRETAIHWPTVDLGESVDRVQAGWVVRRGEESGG